MESYLKSQNYDKQKTNCPHFTTETNSLQPSRFLQN